MTNNMINNMTMAMKDEENVIKLLLLLLIINKEYVVHDINIIIDIQIVVHIHKDENILYIFKSFLNLCVRIFYI